MRFSSKELYGLKAVVEIARHYDEGPVSLAWVARVRGLPLPYLERIISILRKAGLVESARGIKGGYRLTKPPSEISVGDVLRALGSEVFSIQCPVSKIGCIIGERGCCCPVGRECSARELWEIVHSVVFSVLDKVTIAQLVKGTPSKCPEKGKSRC